MRVEMPWPFPGLFEDEVYWQLTAFLARANQVDVGDKVLGPENGDQVLMRPDLVQTHRTPINAEQRLAGVVVVLLIGGALLQRFVQTEA
jgi:hypothetical protein